MKLPYLHCDRTVRGSSRSFCPLPLPRCHVRSSPARVAVLALLLGFAAPRALASPCEPSSGEHFPHAFLVPMGVPPTQGCYTVQLNGIYQRLDGSSRGDFGGHASYGLFDWGGIHLRSLGVATAPTTEVIGMVGLFRDASRSNGISALAIVGLPTGSSSSHDHADPSANSGSTTTFLAGLTGRWIIAPWLRWDANIHYDFTEKHVVPESGLVARTLKDLFLSLDVRATLGSGNQVLALPGVKYHLGRGVYLGLGYEAPLTTDRPYDSRTYLQLEFGSH